MEEEAYTATGMWNKERGPQPAQKQKKSDRQRACEWRGGMWGGHYTDLNLQKQRNT